MKLIDEVYHDPRGHGSNVLCLNGSAHRKVAYGTEKVTCPACLMMIRTGCDATEAIKAWNDSVPTGPSRK